MGVQIRFLPDDVTVEAEAGEPMLQVAKRAGLSIPTGCLMGSCHACEVEIIRETTPNAEGKMVCACITAVPAGRSHLTINLYIDPNW